MGDKIKFSVSIDKKKTIRNAVLILAILFVVGVTIWLHLTEPSLKWSELIKVTTGAFVLIGLIYSIMTYELTQKKNQHDMRMQRIAATYNACAEWYSMTMVDHIMNITKLQQTIPYTHLRTDANGFSEFLETEEAIIYRTSMFCLFNYFESLASAASENLMDEDFIRKYFRGIFIRYHDEFLPWIEHRRFSRQNNNILNAYTKIVDNWKTIK